jgi:FMN reductase
MYDLAIEEGVGPIVVGLGGATRPGSSTEAVLKATLAEVEALGGRTELFGADFLASLPIYQPETGHRTEAQLRFLDAVRRSDGLIIATPAYHGSLSGAVKNALDLLEDLRSDGRPYLDGRAVGCLVTAWGPQAGGATLMAVRAIVHALRGWPTPLGASFNSAEGLFDAAGAFLSAKDAGQAAEVARQVTAFATSVGRVRAVG